MRNLHIIMPMAGEGSRFKKEGWMIPKPLIELKGKPLFIRAIESVNIKSDCKYSFIVRQEHIDEYHIDDFIKNILPNAKVYSVQNTTRGAVETCLIAEDGISDDDAVLVMDCDLEFSSEKYNKIIEESLSNSGKEARGGALVSFKSTNPRYSYASVGEDGYVDRTAEKKVISNHALCGAYFFDSGKEFKAAAKQLIQDAVRESGEFYVSLLYNYLLASGSPVRLANMEKYRSYGTPEELKEWI